ncbi:MAG: T9SS type A sorting domain-containing protein [Flavobacteriaceae bacterium]
MKKFTLPISVFTLCFNLTVFAQDLKVASGGEMYISPTAFVHVSSNLDIDSSGDLIMDSVSDDFSDLYVVGTSTGHAEYRRFTASSATRDLVSPPVSGQAFNTFATDNSGKIAAGTITSGNLMYGPFDKSTGLYVEYSATATTPLDSKKGYRAGTVLGETLAYKGTVNTSDVSMAVNLTQGVQYSESNLVGNPFTTHVNAGTIVTALGTSPAINTTYAAIYGYNGSSTSDPNTWKIINSLSSAAELITPGQGFILISSTVGGSFTIPETARRVSTAVQDDFITGRQSTSQHSSFKLRLTKGTDINETSLYFIDENATRGLDVTYDAGSLGSSIGTHLVEDSQGINMAIQVLPTEDLTATDYVIPVEVSVAAGQQATISVNELNVPAGTEFYLDDAELNIQTLITSNDYTFTPSSALSGIGRFYLRTTNSSTFSSPSNALNSVEVFSLISEKKLVVQGQLRNDSVLKIYDVRGRLIETHSLEASQTKHEIDVSTISSGVYVVNLNNKNQTKTTKLVIN